jgi:hypothetical protein
MRLFSSSSKTRPPTVGPLTVRLGRRNFRRPFSCPKGQNLRCPISLRAGCGTLPRCCRRSRSFSSVSDTSSRTCSAASLPGGRLVTCCGRPFHAVAAVENVCRRRRGSASDGSVLPWLLPNRSLPSTLPLGRSALLQNGSWPARAFTCVSICDNVLYHI